MEWIWMDNSSRTCTTRVRTTANTRIWTAWASRCIKKVWRASSQLWKPPQIKCPTTLTSLPPSKTSTVSSKKRTLASLNPLPPMKRLQLTQMAKLLQPVIKKPPSRSLMHRPRHKQTMLRMVDKRHPQPQSNNKMIRRTIHLPSSEDSSSLLRKFNNQAALHISNLVVNRASHIIY